MKYFEQLNTIEIDEKVFRDLFFKVFIESVTNDKLVKYTLSDYQSIKDLSNEFYGTVEYWWIIAIVNNIYDLNYDWVLTHEQIESISIEKATHSEVLNTDEYLEYYDLLTTENNNKRDIKLIDPLYIKEFIQKFNEQLKSIVTKTEFKEIGQKFINKMNERMIEDEIFEGCTVTKPKVKNLEVSVDLLDVTLNWDLISNDDDWHRICILQNNKYVADLEAGETEHTIVETDNGDHTFDVVLLDRNDGIVVTTTITPSISGAVWSNIVNIPSQISCMCKDSNDNMYFGTADGYIYFTNDFITFTNVNIGTPIISIESTDDFVVAITQNTTFIADTGSILFVYTSYFNNPIYGYYYTKLIKIPNSNLIIIGSGGGRGRMYVADIENTRIVNQITCQYISSTYAWLSDGIYIDENNSCFIQGAQNYISIEKAAGNITYYPYTQLKKLQNSISSSSGTLTFNEYNNTLFAAINGYGTPERIEIYKSSDSGLSWSSQVNSFFTPLNTVLKWCGGNALLLGGDSKIYQSLDNGVNFIQTGTPDGNVLQFQKWTNQKMIAITDGTNNIWLSEAS